jgi:hypothetical protein
VVQEGELSYEQPFRVMNHAKAQNEVQNLNESFRRLRDEFGFDDLTNYGRLKEFAMAAALGHEFPGEYADADAFDKDGNPVEYKSTVQDRINATYNGISVQPTWEKQLSYLREEKICKYEDHFFARFPRHNLEIKEMYRMDGETVLKLLLPKLKRQFESQKQRKDPRLGSSIGQTDIQKHGTRVK